MPLCNFCGRRGLWRRCACTCACYCSKECQDRDWPRHRKACLCIRKSHGNVMIHTQYRFMGGGFPSFALFSPRMWITEDSSVKFCPSIGFNQISRLEGSHHLMSCGHSIIRNNMQYGVAQKLHLGMATYMGVRGFDETKWYTGNIFFNESRRSWVLVPPEGTLTFSMDVRRMTATVIVIDRRGGAHSIHVFAFPASMSDQVFESIKEAVRSFNTACNQSGWAGKVKPNWKEWRALWKGQSWSSSHLNEWMRESFMTTKKFPLRDATPLPVVLLTRSTGEKGSVLFAPVEDKMMTLFEIQNPFEGEKLGPPQVLTECVCSGCRAAAEQGMNMASVRGEWVIERGP